MKRVIVLMLLGIYTLTASACGSRDYIEKKDYNKFKTVATYKDGIEVVDQDTGIGYFIFYNAYGAAQGACVLYDVDGNVYRPNGWRDYGE